MYACFIWIWMPLHYIHMMFFTFFACVAIALFVNRFILGNRAVFIGLETEELPQTT
jgi:SSS family solute:Na+ symporter